MEVTELSPHEVVSWSCVGGASEWVGTKLSFTFTPKDEGTVVLFTHADWRTRVSSWRTAVPAGPTSS